MQAYQTMCTVMLFSQMMLYGSLAVLPKAGNASWWLAALALLPALAVRRLGRWADPRRMGLEQTLKMALGKWGAGAAGIVYGLLLWADIQLALSGLTELTAAFVIEEGGVWLMALMGGAAGIAGVWLGREMGAARCCHLVRWPLAAALAGCIMAALPMGDGAFLFPWQHNGWQDTLTQGLGWSGSLWPMVLVGFAPAGARNGSTEWNDRVLWGLTGVLLLFFGYCFVLPAQALTDELTWGERMVAFLRPSPSKLMWEILLLFKMLVLLLNLCAAASLAGRLINSLVLPKVHPGFGATALLLAALPLAASHTQRSQAILAAAGPWRLPVAMLPLLMTGVSLRIRGRKTA